MNGPPLQSTLFSGRPVCSLFLRLKSPRRKARLLDRSPMSSKTQLGTLTLACVMSEDDDDDFQNPSEAFSVAQSRILSSLNDPCLRARKPADASRPRKRPRKAAATAAEGKENRENSRGLQVAAPFFSILAKDEERVKLGRGDCSSIGSSLISSSDSCIPLVASGTVMQFDCRNELQNEEYSLFQSADSKAAEGGKYEDGGFRNFKAAYSSRSIESRLLASKEKSVANINIGGHLVEDDCEVLEVGTQLNELINLCCGMDEGGSSHGGVFEGNEVFCETIDSEQFTSVACPLCGEDITDFSNELREIHTNDCLDKVGTTEVASHTDEAKSSSPDVVDTGPVIQWLQSLGLSKYKDVIVKEEIDWETLQSLTEEDLLNIGIDALGPRKKIIHALNELRQNKLVQYMDKNTSAASNEKIKLQVPGNKLITEYFHGSSVDGQRVHKTSKPLSEKASKAPIPKRASTATRRAKFRDTPQWCCIAGTPFRVDAFRYLRGDCSHWFLTHFHMDHYQGLTKNFCHGKIFCSSITANLVNMKIGVPWDRLQILPLNQKITIAGVSLTCFDANHCPGAIIILFEPPNGKVVLHTGDFRFSEEMTNNALLQSCHIHTLILDTTYCNPQYDFPKQEAVIQFVIEAIQAEAFNPKTLFLIGSYTIGKERLYLEVARILKKKVYIGAAKLRLLRHLELPEEDMKWLTANEMESHVHVVPMWTLASFKRMKYAASQYSARYDLIVAISPTGWAYGKGKKKTPGRRWQQGTIIRYEVPYSEHSSFTELKEFVRFISPQQIIPSVNNDGPQSADAMISLLAGAAD
ncbi:hypothetical protein ZIOFF_003511 [Zingiber officinale]|uniref:SAM domain-containing protein n=2 Tax=Zingiber officinale TaxID=94328 RepID=A0A8J5I9K9_ZINOF|nr:hypothetical protein ZIOFF_003511 [Zingiber officinale]